MALSSGCGKCSLPLRNMEYRVECDGDCGRMFHLSCTSMNAYELRSCVETENLLWLCDSCLVTFRKQRRSAGNSDGTPTESSVGSSIAKLQEEIHEIKKNMSVLLQNGIAETQPTHCEDNGRPTTSTPRGNNSEAIRSFETSKSPGSFKLRTGSKAIYGSSFSSTKAPDTFWMMFTRVAKHVTVDDIRRMVSNSLVLDNLPIVFELTPRWRNADDVMYASFKVGLDWSLKDKALMESTWPEGLQFREFFPRTLPLWQP